MDRLPGKLPNTASRLIAMAASLTGEPELVKKAMGCSDSDFLKYCAGTKEPAWPEMDKLVSLIIHEQGLLIAKNRDLVHRVADFRSRAKQEKK